VLYGRLRPYLNKVVVADLEGVASGEFLVLRPKDGIESRFLQLAMHSRRFVNDAMQETTGDRPRVAYSTLAEIDVPIAPSSEQRRIVKRIDDLFTEITDGETALTRARTDLDTWRRALLKAAITGELTRERRGTTASREAGSDHLPKKQAERERAWNSGRGRRQAFPPPRDDIRLFDLPPTWAWGQLSDLLIDIEAGLNVSAEGRPPKLDEKGIVKISAVTWGEFDELESKTLPPNFETNERDLIRAGDFLISRANTLELVGAPVIVERCERHLVLSDKVLRLRLVSGVDRWVEICLKSDFGRHQIESYASGNQLSMRNITQKNIGRIALPLPPEEEISEIVSAVRRYASELEDAKIAILDAASIRGLRQSILKAAFEGQLVDQDSEDEPAEQMLDRIGITSGASGQRPSKAAQ
jgi:type I restriction enzyme S subunit